MVSFKIEHSIPRFPQLGRKRCLLTLKGLRDGPEVRAPINIPLHLARGLRGERAPAVARARSISGGWVVALLAIVSVGVLLAVQEVLDALSDFLKEVHPEQ